MPSCSQPSRTLRAAEAVARRRPILDRRCARRQIARAGRDGRMVPIEQKDWTEEDRASKPGQNHPLDSTKRQINIGVIMSIESGIHDKIEIEYSINRPTFFRAEFTTYLLPTVEAFIIVLSCVA